MTCPPFLLAATVLFWGWQCDQWLLAIALGGLLEAQRVVDFRLHLTMGQCQRIMAACMFLFAILAVVLFVRSGAGPAILQSLLWSPLILAPLALLYSDRRSG